MSEPEVLDRHNRPDPGRVGVMGTPEIGDIAHYRSGEGSCYAAILTATGGFNHPKATMVVFGIQGQPVLVDTEYGGDPGANEGPQWHWKRDCR